MLSVPTEKNCNHESRDKGLLNAEDPKEKTLRAIFMCEFSPLLPWRFSCTWLQGLLCGSSPPPPIVDVSPHGIVSLPRTGIFSPTAKCNIHLFKSLGRVIGTELFISTCWIGQKFNKQASSLGPNGNSDLPITFWKFKSGHGGGQMRFESWCFGV